MLVLRLSSRFPLLSLFGALLGVFMAASFFITGGWVVQIVVLAGLFSLVLRQSGTLAAARVGMAFGLGWFLVGISWIYVSMHTYGLMPWWLAALATLLLCAYLALFPALATGLAGWLRQRSSSASLALAALPCFWLLGELLRGVLLTGFPWLATGYAQIDGPLSGYAPLVGVDGVGLATAACAAALVSLAHARFVIHRIRPALLVFVVVPLAGAGLGSVEWSHPQGSPLQARLLQGNVAQDTKFDRAAFEATLDNYFGLIEAAPADLIVLPETALPIFFNELPDETIARLHRDADQMKSTIAVGVPVADSPLVYTNSVVAFSPGVTGLKRYDKSHLVPFGEFVPLGFHWFVKLLRIPLGDFTGGTTDPEPMMLAGQPIGFNICYEDLFGAPLARQARTASILINASNVAWFGDSLALPEHLQIARMRARETARPMLRATNTGMTAAIDAHGAVTAKLAPFTRAALATSVQPMQGNTPYSLWTNWPLWVISLLTLVLMLARPPKPARPAARLG